MQTTCLPYFWHTARRIVWCPSRSRIRWRTNSKNTGASMNSTRCAMPTTAAGSSGHPRCSIWLRRSSSSTSNRPGTHYKIPRLYCRGILCLGFRRVYFCVVLRYVGRVSAAWNNIWTFAALCTHGVGILILPHGSVRSSILHAKGLDLRLIYRA